MSTNKSNHLVTSFSKYNDLTSYNDLRRIRKAQEKLKMSIGTTYERQSVYHLDTIKFQDFPRFSKPKGTNFRSDFPRTRLATIGSKILLKM